LTLFTKIYCPVGYFLKSSRQCGQNFWCLYRFINADVKFWVLPSFCILFVDVDSHISLSSKCDRPSVLCVSTTDTATRLAVHDVLSPTQMPPKKRLRRSASVPGGTRSESRIQSYFVRHRQSSGLQQPVPVHPDVSGIVRTAVVTTLPAVSSGSANVRPDTTGQTPFHFSGSGKLPASPFRSIWVPMPVRPLSECRVESVVKPSASSLSCTAAVGTNHREVSANTASLQTRCHSQPGALLTRSSSLKRRRDEYRPWLDFRKMREVITVIFNGLYYSLFCAGLGIAEGLCPHSSISLFCHRSFFFLSLFFLC